MFIKGYGEISKPLTDLLKKNSLAEAAFNRLKEAVTTAPVLAMPDLTQPFVVETDASKTGIGAVLMQGGRPIAYLSKGLGNKGSSLSTYEKEFLAILLAIEKREHYLEGGSLLIRTDHKS